MQNYTSINDLFWPWLAGLYEGEGCVVVRKPTAKFGAKHGRLIIGMTDYDVIEYLHNQLGGTFYMRPKQEPHHKNCWIWQISTKDNIDYIAEKIMPYLGERRSHDLKVALNSIIYRSIVDISEEELFWSHVEKGEDCWIWNGHKDQYGFGTWINRERDRKQAHRHVRELMNIEMSPKLTNVCGHKNCVNPDHWRDMKKGHTARPPMNLRGNYYV